MNKDPKNAVNPEANGSQRSFEITFEPVYLPKEEDDARIKRLSRQIIACIERARRERARGKKDQQPENDVFRKDFDEIFDLSC